MLSQSSGYLRVQVLAFDTQVSIDDIQAHQQAHDHCSLLLQHQRLIFIEITVEKDATDSQTQKEASVKAKKYGCISTSFIFFISNCFKGIQKAVKYRICVHDYYQNAEFKSFIYLCYKLIKQIFFVKHVQLPSETCKHAYQNRIN